MWSAKNVLHSRTAHGGAVRECNGGSEGSAVREGRQRAGQLALVVVDEFDSLELTQEYVVLAAELVVDVVEPPQLCRTLLVGLGVLEAVDLCGQLASPVVVRAYRHVERHEDVLQLLLAVHDARPVLRPGAGIAGVGLRM